MTLALHVSSKFFSNSSERNLFDKFTGIVESIADRYAFRADEGFWIDLQSRCRTSSDPTLQKEMNMTKKRIEERLRKVLDVSGVSVGEIRRIFGKVIGEYEE